MEVYGELSDQMMLMEMVVDSEGCTTPKRRECRIPEAFVCPPPPRKKAVVPEKRPPPKNGYFQPPDLDSLFVMPSRRQMAEKVPSFGGKKGG